MRHSSHSPTVTLFPFLSVLLSTMGVLAFLSISFLLLIPPERPVRENSELPATPKRLEFEWVGAPGHVKPLFIRCYGNRVEYYDLFENQEHSLSLDELMEQLQGENPQLLSYFIKLVQLNTNIKKNFGKTEYYPLLLVYPDGVLTSELLLAVIEKIRGLNFGLEPMRPDWEIPYQGIRGEG